MKNCLIVLVVLVFCAVVAGWLALHPMVVYGSNLGMPRMIAVWTYYDQGDTLNGITVDVGTNQIDVDIPQIPRSRRVSLPGRWYRHAFYIDSHLDSPPEIVVAQELKNEDLEVDIGRFIPSHPGKIVCVKMFRLSDGERPPYPTYDPKVKVDYPPPKGLIRPGMLQCDLDTLPWHADRIEINHVPGSEDSPQVYTFHSDRPDATSLLVTVHDGRVTEVTGGAEETSDIPYQLPPPLPPADLMASPDAEPKRTWGQWLWDRMFAR